MLGPNVSRSMTDLVEAIPISSMWPLGDQFCVGTWPGPGGDLEVTGMASTLYIIDLGSLVNIGRQQHHDPSSRILPNIKELIISHTAVDLQLQEVNSLSDASLR